MIYSQLSDRLRSKDPSTCRSLGEKLKPHGSTGDPLSSATFEETHKPPRQILFHSKCAGILWSKLCFTFYTEIEHNEHRVWDRQCYHSLLLITCDLSLTVYIKVIHSRTSICLTKVLATWYKRSHIPIYTNPRCSWQKEMLLSIVIHFRNIHNDVCEHTNMKRVEQGGSDEDGAVEISNLTGQKVTEAGCKANNRLMYLFLYIIITILTTHSQRLVWQICHIF